MIAGCDVVRRNPNYLPVFLHMGPARDGPGGDLVTARHPLGRDGEARRSFLAAGQRARGDGDVVLRI